MGFQKVCRVSEGVKLIVQNASETQGTDTPRVIEPPEEKEEREKKKFNTAPDDPILRTSGVLIA